MGEILRVVIVEDSEDDTLLVVRELEAAGYELKYVRVDTAKQMKKTLAQGPWDIIIADYSMPHFSGLDALKMAKSEDQDVPFILVSGTIGEEAAVEAMRVGANDYIMKGHLKFLGPAVRRELREAMVRHEKRCAEQMLREREATLKSIFLAAPIGIGLISDRVLIDFNDRFCEMIGYARDELVGRSSRILYPSQEEYERVGREKYGQIARRGIGTIEAKWKRKDGTVIDVLLSSSPLDPENLLAGVTFTALDITNRKRAEEELRESRQDWQHIFQAIGHPTIILDAQHRILEANDAVLRVTGEPRDELIGKRCYEVFHDPQATGPVRTCPMEEMLLSGNTDTVEMEMQALGRSYLVSCTPVFEEGGQLRRIIHIATDVTERNLAGEALRKSENLLRTVIDSTNDAMISIDNMGLIRLFNPAAEEMFGCEKKEMVGKLLDSLMPNKYRELHHKYVQSYFETGKPNGAIGRTLELAGLRKDGSEFPIAISLSKGKIDDEMFVIAILRDITERKKTEQKIMDYQTKLKSLTSELVLAQERERRRIAVGVHDQIGQKMALVKLETQSLMGSISDAEAMASLSKTCQLMDQVVQDAHSLTFELSNPVLYEIGLDAAVESWLDQHVPKGGELKYSVVSEPSPLRPALEMRIILFAVVQELLANVIKYACASRVRVDMCDDESMIRIDVKDNGVGFDLLQFDHSVKKTGGFGLFHAQERVEYLGGTLTVKSSPGHGTQVGIAVPIEQGVAS